MRIFRPSLMILAAGAHLVLVSACGDDAADGTPAASLAPTPTPVGEQATVAAAPDPILDSCATLTETLVRTTFHVPEETTIRIDPPSRPRGVCEYSWDKPNVEELRLQIAAAQRERMQEMVEKMRRGQGAQGLLDGITDMPLTHNEVSLHFGPGFDTPEIAARSFGQAMDRLQEGIRRPIDTPNGQALGQEVTFQFDLETVEGVGDQARYMPRMSQLAILDGRRIVYVIAKISADPAANLEHARRLAAAVLGQ